MAPSAPSSYSLPRVGIALLVIMVIVVGMAQPSVNDLPGFSDHTGPTEMRVTEFERLESGCEEDVSSRRSGSSGGGNYTQLSFIPTASPDTTLSAWTERTSPDGADLSTFRVHVEALNDTEATNTSCRMGVLYRLTVSTSGGSPPGFLPDSHGTRILWLQNDQYSGCTASVTSPLDAECQRFLDDTGPGRATPVEA